MSRYVCAKFLRGGGNLFNGIVKGRVALWEIGRWRGALGVCGGDGCGGAGWRVGLLWGAGAWWRGRMQGSSVSALERDLGSQGFGFSYVCVLFEEIEKR